MACIVFDLGGVVCQINRDWGSAMRQAGFDAGALQDVPLDHCPNFDAYQRGIVPVDDYLPALRAFLAVRTDDQAIAVHQAILVGQFEGMSSLVGRIRRAGHGIGVLSNTNALHWQVLVDPAHYPVIAGADYLIASHLVKAEKPEAEIYLAFEAESGYRAEDMIFLDDHRPNVEGAKNCGWQAFEILPSSPPTEQVERYLMQVGINLD
ncbi:MAG TPA: hypothetical protein DCQ94_21510 [Nitrospira sp.]|nr:hypothetical protein [Nitrospira sp.]